MLTRDAVVARARSAPGRSTRYLLGAGGRDPSAPFPGTPDGPRPPLCDCSGFVAWCLGIDRFLPNDLIPGLPGDERWFETTRIYEDALSPWGFVAQVPLETTLPGDLLVWPDRPPGQQGHVGLVTEIDDAAVARVMHCSSSNFKHTGDAIQETPPAIFLRNHAIAARVKWVT